MTMTFPTGTPDPQLSPSAWDESRWRSIESWKLARTSSRPFPLKALGTLLLGIETACRGWDAFDAPRPAISDPVYAALGMIVVAMSLMAIAINRSWLFRIMAVVGVACCLEVIAGGAGRLPWAHWDLSISGYVERIVLHAVLIAIAVRRLLQPIDYAEMGLQGPGSSWSRFFLRWVWIRFRLVRERGAHLLALTPEREAILLRLERQVKELRHTDPAAADDVIEFRAGRQRWHARLYPHGVLLARLGSSEWRAVSPRRFVLREPRLEDQQAAAATLVAVIEDEVHPATIGPEQLQRYQAWARPLSAPG